MTVRVSAEQGETASIIRIDGRLTCAEVPDVIAVCESAKWPLYLELSGLTSLDVDGVRALRSLSETGAELLGASPYIRLLLSEASPPGRV